MYILATGEDNAYTSGDMVCVLKIVINDSYIYNYISHWFLMYMYLGHEIGNNLRFFQLPVIRK